MPTALKGQYRIFHSYPDGRAYIGSAWVDCLGVASFTWAHKAKDARLFDSAERAEEMAKAIERTIESGGYGKIILSVVPATGGHSKIRHHHVRTA